MHGRRIGPDAVQLMRYDESTERWLAQEAPFEKEIARYWGDWGVSSEVGRLRAVLMRRPGAEIENMGDPAAWRFREAIDPEVARKQQDALTDIYRAHGVAVHYVEEMRRDRPNAMFMRDLVFMTPEGAILARPAIGARRGEEKYAAKALAKLGIPIVRTVTGSGVFEGACAMWVARDCVVLGTGVRCNEEGAHQVSDALGGMGVKQVIPFPIPYGHAHVDGLMNMLDYDLGMIFPWQTPYQVWKALVDRGINVLEAPSVDEVKQGSAMNWVALEPRKVVAVKGNPETRQLLEDNGVTVIEADVSEIRKGWGGIHCMTVFLKRDEP